MCVCVCVCDGTFIAWLIWGCLMNICVCVCVFVTQWYSFGSAFCGRWFDLEWVIPSIQCWWYLIRTKQLSRVSLCRVQELAGFSGHSNSIYTQIKSTNFSLSLSLFLYIYIYIYVKICPLIVCVPATEWLYKRNIPRSRNTLPFDGNTKVL